VTLSTNRRNDRHVQFTGRVKSIVDEAQARLMQFEMDLIEMKRERERERERESVCVCV
jgi:hypothetical protein